MDDKAKSQKLVNDALWPVAAEEFLTAISTQLSLHIRTHYPADFERIGRYILRERSRKWSDGYNDALRDRRVKL